MVLLCCLTKGQSLNVGSCHQNMTFSTRSSEQLVLFTSKPSFLVLHHHMPKCLVKRLDCCVQGLDHSKDSVFRTSVTVYRLNHSLCDEALKDWEMLKALYKFLTLTLYYYHHYQHYAVRWWLVGGMCDLLQYDTDFCHCAFVYIFKIYFLLFMSVPVYVFL